MNIDAVITWVDGEDPCHFNKLTRYLEQLGIERPLAAAPTRFNQRGEINYAVHSLLRFAPWLNRIFIVTDGQIPPIVADLVNTSHAQKIQIIDHQEIFSEYSAHLPTFNSLSIESLIHRIPGLSAQFIYLNDDNFLIQPVEPKDFFQDQKIVARGWWKKQRAYKWRHAIFKKPIPLNEHRSVQENSAQLAGWGKHFFHLPHAPSPIHREVLDHFYQRHPHLHALNSSHRLRDISQFWPISLAHHLELQNNNAIVDNSLKTVMVHGESHSLKKVQERLLYADKHQAVAFFCAQSMDSAPQDVQQLVFNWLDSRICPIT